MELSELIMSLAVKEIRPPAIWAFLRQYAPEVAKLKDEVERSQKLAYDYIQAYEKLAFGDAALKQEAVDETD